MTLVAGIGGAGFGTATLARAGGSVTPTIPHITAVNLSANTVADDASIGDVVGAVSVTMSSGSFSGTLSLTSNPGSYFGLIGSNLVVAAALPAGPVDVDIVIRALQNGNHWDDPETIAVTAAAAASPLVTPGGDVLVTPGGDTLVQEP